MAVSPAARRRGRPVLAADRRLSVQVSIRLDMRDYDELAAAAKRRHETVTALLRKAIVRHASPIVRTG
jgi:uncharacterized protein (DUF1778 family)